MLVEKLSVATIKSACDNRVLCRQICVHVYAILKLRVGVVYIDRLACDLSSRMRVSKRMMNVIGSTSVARFSKTSV